MNSLPIGIIIFMVVTGIISGFIIMNLRQARAEGIKGADLIKRLAPFLLADALFVVIFVFWLVTNLP